MCCVLKDYNIKICKNFFHTYNLKSYINYKSFSYIIRIKYIHKYTKNFHKMSFYNLRTTERFLEKWIYVLIMSKISIYNYTVYFFLRFPRLILKSHWKINLKVSDLIFVNNMV